jgi:hypothetical protein
MPSLFIFENCEKLTLKQYVFRISVLDRSARALQDTD